MQQPGTLADQCVYQNKSKLFIYTPSSIHFTTPFKIYERNKQRRISDKIIQTKQKTPYHLYQT